MDVNPSDIVIGTRTIPLEMNKLFKATILALAGITPTLAIAGSQTGTGQIDTGNHRMFAWKSDDFSGSQFTREWSGDISYMKTFITNTAGGADSGAAKDGVTSKLVSNLSSSQKAGATVTRNSGGSGLYCCGPKTIISSTSYYNGLDNNYECYIVDVSDYSASSLASTMGLTYKGESSHNGATYKHYTKRYGNIDQIWSIRQSYRNSGTVNVGAIAKKWVNLGIAKNEYCLGWKYNIEWIGASTGNINLSYIDVPYN
jgi:hypothetical protein